MSDLRYHVASLAAVFIALVLGIVVGVGLSGSGFVEEGERRNLNGQIERLRADLEAAELRVESLEDAQRADREFVEGAYPLVAADRLDGVRVARLFLGAPDDELLGDVDRTLADAGASVLRMRLISVPLDTESLRGVEAAQEILGADDDYRALGRALGEEFVAGGETPLWDALAPLIVLERSGSLEPPADAVVVARPTAPQQGPTARFLRGVMEGLAGVPAVGVEQARAQFTAIRAFQNAELSSVDNVDTAAGRLALALLLAGGPPGHYGVKETASAVLPPVEPLEPAPAGD